ncbi:c-type cytochrome, partial [Prosthecobacter sp.]|uniref:DUF7133 domain-containing protein n=1 Tax=Prosthecobacter sp. TaxID=1965333 RepID=UPI0037C872C4
HKHFRAAYAGIQIYQGGRYPADTHGHAFIGNIHDNAIHEEVLTPVGATFKCEPRRDFLRANNGWFRPVSTQTGPDGFLWIMDWCDKYPCYQNAKANPEGVDRERGRIWRVVLQDDTSKTTRDRTDLDLKKLATPDLVKTLEHPNNWMRRMGRRMLVERNRSDSAGPLLQKLLTQLPSPSTCNDASLLLKSYGMLTAPLVNRLATSPDSQHRIIAARHSSSEDMTTQLALAKDPDPLVRLTLLAKLRLESTRFLTKPGVANFKTPSSIFTQWQETVKTSKDADPVLAFMIWQVFEPALVAFEQHALDQLLEVAATTQPLSRILSHKAMRRLCDTRKPENLDLAVSFCEKIELHDILLAHTLDGLVKGQEGGVIKPTKDVSATLTQWRSHSNADVRKHGQTLAVLWGDEAAVKEMIVALHDAKKPEKERIAILQSLRKVRTDTVKEGLKPLLTPQTSTALAVATIRAAADLGGDDFIASLLTVAQASGLQSDPQARGLLYNAAIEALSGRTTWTQAMLNAIAEGKVSPTGFPVPVRRALATSKDKAIRDLAFKVLGAWKDSSDDVKSLIAQKKQACLTGEPDLANGKLIFTATCMVCHEFHGGGQKVGPDLIGSGRSNLDAILANVIDPNQIIGNGYENFTVSTKDGRTLAGRVVEDTPSHVKLLGAGGAAQIVPRDQVATLTNTKQSLMPMGFGNLPDTAFRDLIWYVLAPPEEGPLTKEKKDLLIKGVEDTTSTKPKGPSSRAIDWESVSLWNPEWKVSAPDFERTPVKLGEYYGQKNVLLVHPFPDKKTPASFERKLKVEPGKTKLTATVASDDRGDWTAKVVINGQVVKELTVDHEKPRWKTLEIDLSKFAGQEVTLRLEAHANGWSMEFAYWGGITLE